MNTARTRVPLAFFALFWALFLVLPAAQADVVQMKFVDVVGGLYDRGVGINPYRLDVGPVGGTATRMELLCDDWIDHVWGGATWQANVIRGSDAAALQTTRMATLARQYQGQHVDIVRLYNAKAYLELQMDPDDRDSRIETSFALWWLFLRISSVPANDAEKALAEKAWNDLDVESDKHWLYRDRLTIYSPTAPYNKDKDLWHQEFNRIAVPDGGVTLMLLGGVLVGLEALRRRLRA